MPILQQLSASQSSPQIPINENFETLEYGACYGKKQSTTSALTWGYYGGIWGGFTVAAGTFTLTASATNYIVAAVATGVPTCSTSNTNWNNGTDYKRAYKLTTSGTAVTAVEDHRGGPGGVQGSGGGSAGSLTADTDVTLTSNSDTSIATQKAVKTYVDGKVAGLSWKQAVRAATTANGTLATAFANGQAIDGVTLATGDRILVKNQSSGAENGIYIVAASGAPTRATDADSGAELVNASVYVSEGTTLGADTQWTCTTNAPITVGSTALTFSQFGTGGVTSVAATVPTFLSISGSPITTSGTLAITLSGTALPVINGGTGATAATGTGNVVLATSPTLVTPALGTPSALVLTNATGLPLTTGVTGTLGVANGGTGAATLTANSVLVGAGTSAVTFVAPGTSGNVLTSNGTTWTSSTAVAAGTTVNSQSAAYTLVLGDANTIIYHPAADTTARIWTIPTNAGVAFPVGTIVTFDNDFGAGAITITISTDTLVLVGSAGSTGARTLASGGQATAVKVASTRWRISGTLLS